MKHFSGRVLAVFLVSAVLLTAAHNGNAENRITRDPFAHPDLSKTKIKMVKKKRGKSRAEIIREEAANLELRATIQNGGWSMANINGTLIEEGEKIEGFTLVRVGEIETLLKKEGVEIILIMESRYSLPVQ